MTIAGVTYEVDPEFAGETVVVWWGLFDQELWVEFARSAQALSSRWAARSPCTGTASTGSPVERFVPIGSMRWRDASLCRGQRCRVTPTSS